MAASDSECSMQSACALLVLLCLPGCGSKTGLDSPLPPPCELPPIETPAACSELERGDTVLLGEPRARESLWLDRLAQGPVARVREERDGAEFITMHALDLEGRPTSPATALPRPVARGGVVTVATADGCLPVFSIHAITGDSAPFAPGPCAFYAFESVGFRFLPGVWDRCFVVESGVDGFRFELTRGDRRELRRAGVDGAFLDRDPLEAGPAAPLLRLEGTDGTTSGVFIGPGRWRSGRVVSSSGTTTSLDLGGTPLSIAAYGSSMFWVRDGTLFVMTIDERGDPILPFQAREELGTNLLSAAAEGAGDVVWLLLWRESPAGVSLVRVDDEIEIVGPILETGLVPPAQFVRTPSGLLMVGAAPDSSLVALPWTCAG